MNQLSSAFTLFLSLLVEAIPFLLLGVLLSGMLLLFVSERKLIALMPKHPFLGALMGSLIGFLFPVCECGNVPVARRLLMQGAPASVAMGFLLAAPTINPVVIWATWTAFRDQPEIVVLRVVLSLSIATIIGSIFGMQKDIRPFLQPSLTRYMFSDLDSLEPAAQSPSNLLQTGTFFLGQPGKSLQSSVATLPAFANIPDPIESKPLVDRLQMLLENSVKELRELGGILIIGSAIATVIQVGIPREIIINLGQGPISSILAMMLLAAIVSICSTVDSFFALSFASTFTSGSLLAFLVFGPMIDLKSIGLILTIFKKRAVFYLFLISAQLTFLACLFINLNVR